MGSELIREVEFKIRNVIATADLKQKVSAEKFIDYPWGTYDLQYYGGRCGYVKDETIEGRVSVFLSGKMISTGAKSVEASIIQLENTRKLLVMNGFVKNIKLTPKIQNIVATINLGARIDLNKIVENVPRTTYEPDQFPGAIVRPSGGPVCLMFASGKIIIVGSKSEVAITDTVKNIIRTLKPFYVK